MRKTFKFFCAAAMAVLAVSSCGKIWDEFDSVHGEIDSLKERVTKLEKDLNAQVSTINSKITALEAADKELAASITDLIAQLDALDGKVDGLVTSSAADLKAAIDELKAADEALAKADTDLLAKLVAVGVTNVAKNEAGNAVITFTDGSTLEVPAQPQTGVVTVVEVDGVKYWAVIVDGEAVSLEVPVGHLALKFKVDYDTNALMYSVDGGTTWNRTGAYVASSQYSLFSDFYQGGEMDPMTWEYVENDYYTLVFGGEEYYLPIYKADNASISLKAGKTYFKYGETKEVAISVAGMADFYVMSKPDGWKANIESKKLIVTAPAEAVVGLGVADLEGEVLLHATTTEGKCKIVKFAVSTTAGLTVTVDKAGNVTIANPVVHTSQMMDPLEGFVTTYGFAQVMLGLAPIDAFSADPVAYVNNCYQGNNYEDIYTFYDNFRKGVYDENDDLKYPPMDYVAGEYEVDECTFPISDLYGYATWGSEMPKGEHFVVWAVAFDENNAMMADDLSYVYYEPMEVDVKLVEASFSDITVNVSVSGAQKFLAGFVAESTFTGYGLTFDEYMQNQEGPFGRFVNVGSMAGYEEYAEYYMGLALVNGTEGEYKVSSLNAEGYADVLSPGTKYYVWAMPVLAGLNYGEYDYETNFKPYVYEFETDPLVYDASSEATATITYTTTTTSIKAEVAVENAVMAYYMWFEADVDVNEMSAEELASEVVAEGYPSVDFPISVYEQSLNAETTKTLVVVAVDENGAYADPVYQAITTNPVPYTTAYSVELKGLDMTTANNSTATFAVTGNAQKVVCWPAYYDTYTTNFVKYLLQYSIAYYSFKTGTVADGAATVTGLNFSTNKYLIYAGYAEDAEGNITFNEPKVVDVTTWTPAE